MKDLAGKVAVVTGAASGIGLEMCRTFAAQGMKIVMGDVEPSALEAAAASVAERGTEVLPVICDVALARSVDDLAQACLDRFGAAHLVCNNAGVASAGFAWEQPLAEWEWVIGVNLWGVVNGVRAFVPTLLGQGEGHIVNTASMAGLVPLPASAPYTVSKHAVVGLTESLFFEMKLSGKPIGVSVLCPGWVNTRIGEAGRNWPDRLGPNPAAEGDPAASGGSPSLMKDILSQGMDPAAVAAMVLDAVVNDKFWILTHPEMGKAVLERYQRAVEGRNPEFVFGGLVPGFD